jgi:hypothetical protein
MEMQVMDCLSPVTTAICNDAKAVWRQAVLNGKGFCCEEDLSQEGRVLLTEVHQSGNVFLWNDELMNRSLRIDILDCNKTFSLVCER